MSFADDAGEVEWSRLEAIQIVAPKSSKTPRAEPHCRADSQVNLCKQSHALQRLTCGGAP